MHLFPRSQAPARDAVDHAVAGSRRIDPKSSSASPSQLPEEVQRLERVLGHTLTLCIEQTEADKARPIALLSGLAVPHRRHLEVRLDSMPRSVHLRNGCLRLRITALRRVEPHSQGRLEIGAIVSDVELAAAYPSTRTR